MWPREMATLQNRNRLDGALDGALMERGMYHWFFWTRWASVCSQYSLMLNADKNKNQMFVLVVTVCF